MTLNELKKRFSNVGGVDVLTALSPHLNGVIFNVQTIIEDTRIQPEIALDVIARGSLFFDIQWAKTGGYQILGAFNEIPVMFTSPSDEGQLGRTKIVSQPDASGFSLANPTWTQLSEAEMFEKKGLVIQDEKAI